MKQKHIHVSKLKGIHILALGFLLPVSLWVILIPKVNHRNLVDNSHQCYTESNLILIDNITKSLLGEVRENQAICFHFYADTGKSLILNTNTKITLFTPNKDVIRLQGSDERILQYSGSYSVIMDTDQAVKAYQISLRLESRKLATKPSMKKIVSSYYGLPDSKNTLQLTYNVVTPPPFKPEQELQETVNSIVNLVQSKGLPVERLSVSLIDLNSSECCAYASYLDQEPRFPASIVKLFWMVYLYGQYQKKVLPEGTVLSKTLLKMIQDSDNESASFIVDTITGTEPGESLPPDEIQKWMQKRYGLNFFFDSAGYNPINISQKVFPTNYIKNDKPAGRDLQIRGDDEINPVRNYITSVSLSSSC